MMEEARRLARVASQRAQGLTARALARPFLRRVKVEVEGIAARTLVDQMSGELDRWAAGDIDRAGFQRRVAALLGTPDASEIGHAVGRLLSPHDPAIAARIAAAFGGALNLLAAPDHSDAARDITPR